VLRPPRSGETFTAISTPRKRFQRQLRVAPSDARRPHRNPKIVRCERVLPDSRTMHDRDREVGIAQGDFASPPLERFPLALVHFCRHYDRECFIFQAQGRSGGETVIEYSQVAPLVGLDMGRADDRIRMAEFSMRFPRLSTNTGNPSFLSL
jgi:hypothetical protein